MAEWPGRDVGVERGQHDQRCHPLQGQPEQSRHPPGLPRAHPERPGAFQRPRGRGPLGIQRQRDRQRHEPDADGQQAFAEQPHLVPPLVQGKRGDPQIGCAERQRGKGAAIFEIPDEADLQSEPDQRGAEQQRRIRRIAQLAGGIVSIEQCHRQVDHDGQRQEQLARQIVLIGIAAQPPQPCQRERGKESQQVERTPAFLPRDHQDREVEHGDIGEQWHRGLAFPAEQHRHGKAAQECGQRHRLRILQDRQRAAQRRKHDHEAERGEWRHDFIEPGGGEHGEVHHRHARPLQREAETGLLDPLAKAECQQPRANRADRRQPQLDREQPGVRDQPDQERQPDEQDHQPDPDDGVAAQQPALRLGEQLADGEGRGGGWGGGRRSDHLCRRRFGGLAPGHGSLSFRYLRRCRLGPR